MKTLFVTDLDGTLLTKEGRIPTYSVERLNRMIEAGMTFTFATARSHSSAMRAVEGLLLRAPVVLYNGGIIHDCGTGRTLFHSMFSTEEKWYILGVLQKFGIEPMVFGASAAGKERVAWLANRESVGVQRYLAYRRGDVRLGAVASEGELLEGHVFNFKCIGPQEQLERAWNDLKLDDRFICIFHQETYQNDFWIEISPRVATKANGVRFLKNYLGCDRAVCFGDSSNDSDMFDVCDEKYAVMNADKWLKDKATGVVGYCEEDGVAKWLEQHSGF